MTIEEIQREICEEFALFDNWMDKYEYLIDLGKKVPIIDKRHKTEQALIEGCQSQVWLYAQYDRGVMQFTADSDAIITKGIISLLIRVLSGQKPEAIANVDLWFIDEIGLQKHLSLTRANGLVSMIRKMKQQALAVL